MRRRAVVGGQAIPYRTITRPQASRTGHINAAATSASRGQFYYGRCGVTNGQPSIAAFPGGQQNTVNNRSH